MTMLVEHHDLHHDFPEYLDHIYALKTSSEQFGHLYDEYHQLTREVERLEEEDLPVDDFTIENMKKQRVWLKDQMYRMLVACKNGD
ncbi:YdcH family protein [Accumulibacter sp.]